MTGHAFHVFKGKLDAISAPQMAGSKKSELESSDILSPGAIY